MLTSNDVPVSVVYDVADTIRGWLRLLVIVLVLEIVGTVTHSTEITHAETLAIVVSVACHSSIPPTHKAVDVDAVNPAIGKPVALVNVQEDGVPKAPPFVTKAQAEPTLIASAVHTPVHGVMPAQVVRSESYACTVDPIASVYTISQSDTAVLNCALVPVMPTIDV